MEKNLEIDLYLEDGVYCAYIGAPENSGYKCVGKTPEECAENVKQYLIDEFNWL